MAGSVVVPFLTEDGAGRCLGTTGFRLLRRCRRPVVGSAQPAGPAEQERRLVRVAVGDGRAGEPFQTNRDEPDLAGGLAEGYQPLVASARRGGITGELVTGGYSGECLSGGERHPEALEGATGAVEEGPGAGVVAVLLGDDGCTVGGERAWADGGYHGFCVVEHGVWCAISSSSEVLTGNTPDGLDQQIRAHWQALQ